MAGWNALMGGSAVTPAPRRPSSLLQCMDTDQNGNLQIDAFRYIEYSRQRRMEFMKRANFICTMNSSLQANAGAGSRRMPTPPMPAGMWNLSSSNSMHSPMLPSFAATNTAPLSTAAAMNRAVMQQAQRVAEERNRREFGSTLLAKHKMAAWEQLHRLQRDKQPHQQEPPKEQRRLEEFEAAEALLFSRNSTVPSKKSAATASISKGAMDDKRNDGASADDDERREGTSDSVDDDGNVEESSLKSSSKKKKRKKTSKTEHSGKDEGRVRRPYKKRAKKE